MTDEASTMVVVARAALEGALRAALPHVARRIPEDAPDNGAGLMRLAVVQDCVMVLAVAIDRKRAIAVRFTVLDGDSYGDGVKSMWLRRSAVEALATFLAGSPVERVSLLLDEREGITVQETGVLYGPQMARVAPAAEPMDEDRVDAARLLLDGAHGVLYQDAAVEMDPAVVRTFAASAAAWQIPLRVRVGDGYGRSSFIWGTDACLGWSAGSVLLQAPVTGELLYDGPSIPYLEEALLPPVLVGSAGLSAGLLEDAVSALVAEKHGPDCVVGSWVLVAESIAPEDGKDRSAWLCEGQGSPLSRRGLVECARDMYARSVRRFGDD